MKTTREIEKIKAVALFILKHTGTSDLISLYKRMYFSQKVYLARYGRPIFEDSFRARPRGPVPSFTAHALSCAFSGNPETTPEVRHFNDAFAFNETNGIKFVSSILEPDLKKISGMEQKTLLDIIDQTKNLSSDELSELSHDDAWATAFNRSKNDPADNYISMVNMAKAGDASEDAINYIRQRQLMSSFAAG